MRSRKELYRALDAEFSKQVRERTKAEYGDRCPFCGINPIQECFHWRTRAKGRVRWDFTNAIGACDLCNKLYEVRPRRFEEWFLDHYGVDAWYELKKKSNVVEPISRVDLEMILQELKGGRNGKEK